MLPYVILNTEAKMPRMGLGTWQGSDPESGVVKAAVECAIDVGYRLFDTALAYSNESEVGEGIQSKINEGKVKRDDIFITTKVPPTYFGPTKVRESFEISKKRLNVDYIDLYLMHWPFAFQFTEPEEFFPKENGNILLDESIDYIDVWKQMEELYNEGLVRAIGICNFNEFQINRIIREGSIVPAVHQYECHPYLDQDSLLKFCQANGIVVTGYSPFGSPGRPWAQSSDPNLLEDPILKEIAKKRDKTVAQILLRYELERGIVLIPKTGNPSRMVSNMEVYDFKLAEEEKSIIKKLDRNWHYMGIKVAASHKYHPFRENYSE